MGGEVIVDANNSQVIAKALTRIATNGEDNAKQIAVIVNTQEHLAKSLDKLAETTNTLVATTQKILSDKIHLEKDIVRTFDTLNDKIIKSEKAILRDMDDLDKKINKTDYVVDDLSSRVQACELYSAQQFGEDKVKGANNSKLWGNWYKVLNVLMLMVCAAFTAGVYINQHTDLDHKSHNSKSHAIVRDENESR